MTNTNWQYYGGETTMTYFSQMVGLTVQNFASAAVGIVVAIALIAASPPHEQEPRQLLCRLRAHRALVLLPISIVSALVLVSQGSIQNIAHYVNVHGISGLAQTIAMGPVASQEVIKELGTNGAASSTSTRPTVREPNGFTNFYEMFLVLIIPASLVWTYGKMAGSRRQALAIFATMFVMFIAA